MMAELVDIVNQLQDVFSAGISSGIDLPQIVVVGSQSAGKSSILEQIVGKSFLPRGTGIVTRCPLVLQLVHAPDNTEEYATFQHNDTKQFTDCDLIRKEIEDQTTKLAGAIKGICPSSINLKIYSPSLLDLTLVDLPGLMKVPVGDQPANIEEQTRDLILTYIKNPKSIILAVTPANVDMATSDSLKIAKEVDPQGTRTLAVLTKLDLMDKGTDAWDMLQGKVIPVKLGIIGVVNRSQKDINEDKTIKENLDEEAEFFKKNYGSIASIQGSAFLARTVQAILINHIKNCMPDLKNRISQKLYTNKQELSHYAKSGLDNNALVQEIIFNFNRIYTSSLNGCTELIKPDDLCGGARIQYVVKNIFAQDLKNIDPLHNLKEATILTAINNANGMNPDLFLPGKAFQILTKGQIEQFRDPSVKCLDLVHDELYYIAQNCLEDDSLQLEHYPQLKTVLVDIVYELLQSQLLIAKEAAENFIDIQMSYVNTSHPDFVLTSIQQRSIISNKDKEGKITRPHVVLKLPLDTHQVLSVDTQHVSNAVRDVLLMQNCIKSYMAVVSKIVEDTVPKMIMHYLVNVVVEKLHKKLVQQIPNKGNLEDLLCESTEITRKRNEIEAEIAKLEKANKIVRTIYTKPNKIVKL